MSRTRRQFPGRRARSPLVSQGLVETESQAEGLSPGIRVDTRRWPGASSSWEGVLSTGALGSTPSVPPGDLWRSGDHSSVSPWRNGSLQLRKKL